MNKLIATGVLNGTEIELEVELINGKLIVNDPILQQDLDYHLENAEPIGGTYYPPKNTLLAAYSVLNSNFFDVGSNVNIEVIGELEKIPSKANVIY
jgi:hypothetical protein